MGKYSKGYFMNIFIDMNRLIAIMVGRLNMSAAACQNSYIDLSKKIFGKKGWDFRWPYKKDILEENIIGIVQKELKLNADEARKALLKGPEDAPCKA